MNKNVSNHSNFHAFPNSLSINLKVFSIHHFFNSNKNPIIIVNRKKLKSIIGYVSDGIRILINFWVCFHLFSKVTKQKFKSHSYSHQVEIDLHFNWVIGFVMFSCTLRSHAKANKCIIIISFWKINWKSSLIPI